MTRIICLALLLNHELQQGILISMYNMQRLNLLIVESDHNLVKHKSSKIYDNYLNVK